MDLFPDNFPGPGLNSSAGGGSGVDGPDGRDSLRRGIGRAAHLGTGFVHGLIYGSRSQVLRQMIKHARDTPFGADDMEMRFPDFPKRSNHRFILLMAG